MKILLGDSNAKVGKEDIYKPSTEVKVNITKAPTTE